MTAGLFTSTLGCDAAVSIEAITLGGEAVMERISLEIWKAIHHEAHSLGAEVRPQSIHYWRDESTEDTFIVKVHGIWHPDAREGVELRGGPCDGQIIQLPQHEAPWGIRVMRPARPPLAEISNGTELYPTFVERMDVGYDRAGIDVIHDRWVYMVAKGEG